VHPAVKLIPPAIRNRIVICSTEMRQVRLTI